jgi:hypothetical protein
MTMLLLSSTAYTLYALHADTLLFLYKHTHCAGVAEHGLDMKAAALMGDKGLERRALDAVGDHAQLNKKASHL